MVEENYSTKQFARSVVVEPHTIRRGYCVNGHYLNIRPLKLPNGRLLWPAAEVRKVIGAAR